MSKRTLSINFIVSLLYVLLLPLLAHAGQHDDLTEAPRVLLGASPQVPPAASADKQVLLELPSLRAKALEKGTVRVIIGVRVPFAAEGHLSADTVATQRQEIASMQDQLLSRLTATPPLILHHAYKTVPFIALSVNAATLEKLLQAPEVSSIEEDKPVPPALNESVSLIGGDVAWSMGYGGAGQAVVILDTGVEKTHPFLAGKVVAEACYSSTDPSYNATTVCPGGVSGTTAPGSGVNCPSWVDGCTHGTHVAGIAAGKDGLYTSNYGIRYSFSGVAKDASLIPIQVFFSWNDSAGCAKNNDTAPCARTFSSDQNAALGYVYTQLRTQYNIASVNMSLGGGSYTSYCDGVSSATKAHIDNLRSVGVATVIATGNNGYTNAMASPACISSAISVGNTTTQDVVSYSSNSATFLNLLAPGTGIISSVPGGGYDWYTGTSMAAPHVAGAWAVLKSKKPTASVSEIYQALASTGTPVLDTRNGITKPRINIDDAIQYGLMRRVAAGSYHSLAIHEDGSVWAFGGNQYGQLGNSTNDDAYIPVMVDGLPLKSEAVVAGTGWSMALQKGGSVATWGWNFFGQLGNGNTTDSNHPVWGANSYLPPVQAIAAGSVHAVALGENGRVYTWGDNTDGQLGSGTAGGQTTIPNSVSVSDVVAIAAGGSHTLALKGDGRLYAWGANFGGQIGNGVASTTPVSGPVQVLSGVSAIAAGSSFSVALKTDGTVWVWGMAYNGLLGNGTSPTYVASPTQVSTLSNVVAITAGDYHIVAKKADGTVWAWGSRQTRTGGTSLTPVQVHEFNNAVQIVAGWVNTFGLFPDGTVWVWGTNSSGQFGNGVTNSSYAPIPVQTGINLKTILKFTTDAAVADENQGGITLTVRREGSVNGPASVMYGTSSSSATSGADFVQTSGTLSWGSFDSSTKTITIPILDDSAPEGDEYFKVTLFNPTGGIVNSLREKEVRIRDSDGSTNVTPMVRAAGAYTLALRSDGSVWSWGYNGSGQLGNGSTTNAFTPTQVKFQSGGLSGTLQNVLSISAGSSHAGAVRLDGTVWTWGDNQYGQLGNGEYGSGTSKSIPAQMQNLINAKAIAVGGYHTVVLRKDGSVAVAGDDSQGQWGSNIAYVVRPVYVSAEISNVTAIAAGTHHTLALKSDGTVWAWGGNNLGQLGNGAQAKSTLPVQVLGIANVIAIAAYSDHSLALKADGTVWEWGQNEDVEISKKTTYYLTPTQVPGLGNVKTITAGYLHHGVIKSDGTLWQWGYLDTSVFPAVYSYVASQVAGFSGTLAASFGGVHNEVIKPDCTVWGWGNNSYGQLGNGLSSSAPSPVVQALIQVCSQSPVVGGTDGMISHYYAQILNREPDVAGQSFWQAEVARMASAGIDTKEVFIAMAANFYNSPEFQARNMSNGEYLQNLYRSFFNREPDSAGLSYWNDLLAQGLPREMAMFGFMFSTEFENFMAQQIGSSSSRPEAYAVMDFYRGALNRLPDTTGLNFWLGRYREAQCQAGTDKVGAILRLTQEIGSQFFSGTEYQNRVRDNMQFVSDLYNTMLRRHADIVGLNYWVNQLNQGIKSRIGIMQEFINSQEFLNRRVTPIAATACITG